MDKNIQNQLNEIFSSLKGNVSTHKGYCIYVQACRPAPSRATAVLWPSYIAYEGWKKGYVSGHDSDRKLVFQVVLDGDMRISNEGKELLLTPGMVGLILPGTLNISTGPSGFSENLSLVFTGTALEAILYNTDFPDLTALSSPPESFFLLIRKFIDMVLAPETDPTDISAAGYKLILKASELYRSKNDLPESLSLAIQYMQSEMSSKLSIHYLAYNAHCSRQELQKLFKRYFNETPFTYFMKLRLETAREFLRNSKLSIKEISLQCGFRSQLYFSSAFRKRYKESPREYRKHILSGKIIAD